MKRSVLLGLVACGAALAAPARAAVTSQELDSRLWEAAEVVEEFTSIPESSIPPSLLQKAKAIGIFPNQVKAGLFLAGQFGHGVVLTRDEKTGQWSAPAFFRMSGGSFGLQLGGQASDVVFVVTNERGVQGLLQNKFTLGADASVAAGPVGRDAEARTDWHLKANVLSYSRSKGLFAGLSLDGVMINQDRDANALYYGPGATAQDILMGGKYPAKGKAKELADAVAKHT
jgi:lipid-binding SYLF domain-containing protein